jgi:endonuclease/exonuclease/phosphatase family metal-dependent hydrolase
MRLLKVFNVHLTSNLQTDSSSKRREQLLEVSKHAGGHHAVIAGDFNEREIVDIRGFQDAISIHQDEPAERFATFNPATNKYAVGMPGALDHVLVSVNIAPVRLSVRTDVVLSDHHPLIAELNLQDVVTDIGDAAGGAGASSAAVKSDQTALSIVLPFVPRRKDGCHT